MKLKKFALALIALFAIGGLASCDSTKTDEPTTEDPGTTDSPNTTDPDNSTDEVEAEVLYTVTVLMPDGKPATETNLGANLGIQLCTTESCKTPASLDANGKVEFEKSTEFTEEDTYYLHLNRLPDTYTFDSGVSLSKDNKNLTVQLYEVTTLTGTGTSADTFAITKEGYFNTTLASATDVKYYSFTPETAGTYVVESMVNLYETSYTTTTRTTMIPLCDPLLFPYTLNGTAVQAGTKAAKVSDTNVNFRYEFTVDANATELFAIRLTPDNLSTNSVINNQIVWALASGKAQTLTFSFSVKKK